MGTRRNKVAKRRRVFGAGTSRKKHPRQQFSSSKSSVVASAQLGLVADPNVDLIPSRASKALVQSAHFVPTAWAAKPITVKEFRLSETEVSYIRPLVAKHSAAGAEAMRRDLKLNYNQLSEGQLQRLIDNLPEDGDE